MTLAIVTLRRNPTADPEVHQIRINGGDPTFHIGTDRLANWAVGPVAPRHLDLLDIAAAVFAADRKFRRGGDQRFAFGRGWARQLDFRIEVRDHAFWTQHEVTDCLVRTITFLTGDDVSFAFDAIDAAPPESDYMKFAGSGPEGIPAEHVVLF